MFIFILGREFKLSIAEIYSLFPKAEYVDATQEFLIVDNISKDEITEKFKRIGGIIKVIEVQDELDSEKDFLKFSIEYIEENKKNESGKYNFGLAKYGEIKSDLFTSGIQIKKELVKSKIGSIRFVNKENRNINSAVYKNEKLGGENGTELNIVMIGLNILAGNTIIFQDVDEYSKRDLGKSRDMQVGMLPVKLAQMMINISGSNTGIYDPFCGLGTVLIEAANAGYRKIYGSDIRQDLVDISEKNLESFIRFGDSSIDYSIFEMDVMDIGKTNKKLDGLNIVTEGYLGDIMTKGHVTLERIDIQCKNLAILYEGFFSGLRKTDFSGNIVISFPFWEFKGKFYYFTEVYGIMERYGFKPQKLLPENIEFKTTKSGSILYKREDQQVGREIFKLKRYF
ncbi:MAG: DNA methyltransferase [Candidatus Gracilibacteria bacterium]|nr:DNA methyltransferase [Candidatus Gracilibacteria bacterium]